MPEEYAVPGEVVAIQSFGDFLGFNPHLHVLLSDGYFYGDSMFKVSPSFETHYLEKIFRYKVFKMLFSKAKITERLFNMFLSWRHSGFNVFCGQRILPNDEKAMVNMAAISSAPLFLKKG